MNTHAPDEFHLSPFAEFYEPISDSFIDFKRAADSLKLHIRRGSELFEVGLGTGYFASMFTRDGYHVRGIQPRDEMLPILKRNHADIRIVAECKLEDYEFTEHHETIVSHSSAFLFTRHEVAFGHNGEALTSYIFQSFIMSREEVINCLRKTLQALTQDGQLFINIQSNPLQIAEIGDGEERLTFEMTRCNYFLELGFVEKTFRLTYQGHTYHVNDNRFCATYTDFSGMLSRLGYRASISEGREWVIVKHAG